MNKKHMSDINKMSIAELEYAVAVEVMGWHRRSDDGSLCVDGCWLCDPQGDVRSAFDLWSPIRCSTWSAEQRDMVVSRMRSLGMISTLQEIDPEMLPTWEEYEDTYYLWKACFVPMGKSTKGEICAYAESPGLAVCRAALKAVRAMRENSHA